MKDSKKIVGYDVLYIDDIRLDGRIVRRIWPEHSDVFPAGFLESLKQAGYQYEIVLSNQVIDLV